jgi:hypothetical protein
MLTLSVCASKYLQALYDPFLCVAPCIPAAFSPPSQKYTVWSRGTFTVGTAGSGGVAYWPFRMAFSDQAFTGTYYYYPIVTTSGTYTATSNLFVQTSGQLETLPGVASTTFLGQVGQAGSSSPYTQASFFVGAQRNMRLVGAGIAVEFCDMILNMSGDYYLWRNPSPSSYLTTNESNFGALTAIKSCTMTKISSAQVGTSYLPSLGTDLDIYPDPGYPAAAGAPVFPRGIIDRLACAVFISNAQPGQRFNYSAIAHFEAYGSALPVTPSSSDPPAVSAIIAAAPDTPPPAEMKAAVVEAQKVLVQNAINDGHAGVQELRVNDDPKIIGQIARSVASVAQPILVDAGRRAALGATNQLTQHLKRMAINAAQETAKNALTQALSGRQPRKRVAWKPKAR